MKQKNERKKEREIIILSLYSLELSNNNIQETINYIAEENKMSDPVSEFISESVHGVMNEKQEIDELITKNLEGYKLDRLSYVDLQILRFATYELMHQKEATAVVINEAVELTKKYSDLDDNKASKFNNSVLDKIRKSLEQ